MPATLSLHAPGQPARRFKAAGPVKQLAGDPLARFRGFSVPLPAEGARPRADLRRPRHPGQPGFSNAHAPAGDGRARSRGWTSSFPWCAAPRILRDCLASLHGTLPPGTRIVVVDDGATDQPLIAVLRQQERAGRIVVLRHPQNRGYPAAINTGLRHAAGRDVVLLNADTVVPPGWLARLAAAAYAAPDIGSATPLSNEGSIVFLPRRSRRQPGPARRRPAPGRPDVPGRQHGRGRRPADRCRLLHVRAGGLPRRGRRPARGCIRAGLRRGKTSGAAGPPPWAGATSRRRTCSSAISAPAASARRRRRCWRATWPRSIGCTRATTPWCNASWRRTRWRSRGGGWT